MIENPEQQPTRDFEPAGGPEEHAGEPPVGDEATVLNQSGSSVLESLIPYVSSPPQIRLRDSSAGPDEQADDAGSPHTLDESVSRRYRFVGEIARGGMGAVYRARDNDLGRELAVKILLERLAGDSDAVGRFVEEAQIAGQLQHPGIAPVYELGQFRDRRPYFTMKLIKGRTLAELFSDRDSPADDRPRLLGIFAQVCQALAYAHSRGVIHRDLKPANIMVGAFGEVQVMDWGLAKVLIGDESAASRKARAAGPVSVIRTVRSDSEAGTTGGAKTLAGSVMGTPAYMAPEQARGETDELDERSDVFGLGAILCELLTGTPPFSGQSSTYRLPATDRDILEVAHRRIAAGEFDEELRDLARDCLNFAPHDRPADAGAVAERITGHLAGVESRLQQARIEQAAAQARAVEETRRRRLTMALAVSVLLLAGVFGGAWTLSQRARSQRLAETARLVDAALDDAARLRGEARTATPPGVEQWNSALEAARRATTALDAGEDDHALRTRVATLLAAIESESASSQRAATQAERDRRMLERLAGVRTQMAQVKAGRYDTGRADPEYAAAFRDYGIDIEKLPVATAGERIRRRNIARELAVALDDWALVRRGRRDRKHAGWKRLFEIASAADPDPARDRLRQALSAWELSSFRELASAPTSLKMPVTSQVLLGQSLGAAGDVPAAVAFLKKTQRLHPGDFWTNYYLARYLTRLEPAAWDESARYYTAALAVEPNNPGAQSDLGFALNGAGRVDDARAAFERAIAIQPENAIAHFNLGVLLAQKQQWERALAAFQAAVKLRPDLSEAHYYLATTLIQKGEKDAAIAAFKTAVRHAPRSTRNHYNLGLLLFERNDMPGSIAALREAVRLDADNAPALAGLGRSLHKAGDHRAALKVLQRDVKLDPKRAESHAFLADVLMGLGEFGFAADAWRAAAKLQPDYAVAHYNLGIACTAAERGKEAIDAYREAVRLDPDFAEAHCNLGNSLRHQGRFAEALKHLQRGHKLGSSRPGWRYPSKLWIRAVERLIKVERELPARL